MNSRLPTVVVASIILMCLGVQLQTVSALVHGPQMTFANKYRTWIGSSERLFRPLNKTGTQIPKHATPIDPPKISKSVSELDIDDHLVFFGGEKEDENIPGQNIAAAHNDVYLYDFDRNQWFNESTFNGVRPSARYDHVSWTWEDTLYVHGGVNDTVIGDVWAYRNRTWVEKTARFRQIPSLKGHSAQVLAPEGPVYIFGGINSEGDYTKDLYVIDHNGTQVKSDFFGTAPSARAYHASARVYTKGHGWIMLVMGGTDGAEHFKDLYAFYERTRTWVLLNPGFTPQRYSFDGTLLPKVSIPGVHRHSCAAKWPIMMCVGGKTVSTPIVLEYDLSTNLWIRTLFTNPTRLPPTTSHMVRHHVNRHGHEELLVIGGITGAPTKFTNPDIIFKTMFYVDACPTGYINPDGDGKCFKCHAGTGLDLELYPRECRPCLKGTYSDNEGRCAKCPLGTYNPLNGSANVSACLQCPDGYFTVGEGSHSHAHCQTCELGYYSLNRRCTACPPGTYGKAVGQLHMDLGCAPCPYGQWSRKGSTTCDPCAAGTSSGPFIQRSHMYNLEFRAMFLRDQTSLGASCYSFSPLTTVETDKWVWLVMWPREYASISAFRSTNVRLDVWAPNLQLTASFDGNDGVMYYGCNNVAQVPSCNSVAVNESTPGLDNDLYASPCYGNQFYGFRLRFQKPNTPSNPTTRLRIMGSGLVPYEMSFTVVSTNFNVEFGPNADWYAAGIASTQPLVLRAIDPYGTFDETVNSMAPIRATCTTGGSPSFSLDGGATYSGSPSAQFTDGIANVYVMFEEGTEAKDCSFGSTGVTSPHPTFNVQTATEMILVQRSVNVSNHGVMRIDAYLVNSTGDVVRGDNSSMLHVRLADDHRMRDMVWIREVDTRVRVNMGHGVFDVTLFTYNNTGMWGRLIASQLEGQPTKVPEKETDRFFITPANGTMIQQVNDRYPFPETVPANSTFVLEYEVVDKFGQHDSSRSPMTRLQLTNCPGAYLRLVNSSQFGQIDVRMLWGRAVVYLYIQGTSDAEACRIGVHEISRPDRTTGFWSTPFSIRTPKRVSHDYCEIPNCGSCPTTEAGTVVEINITMLSGTNQPVEHDNINVVRVDVLGNASAAYEVDHEPERRLVNGRTTFKMFVLGQSSIPFRFLFTAGYWASETPLNITYATIPSFVRDIKELDPIRVFKRTAYINSAETCDITTGATTSQISLSDTKRVATWYSNNDEITFDFEATNDFGILDTAFASAFTLDIRHCYGGVENDITWQVVDPDTGNPTAFTGAGMTLPAFVFNQGRGSITVMGSYGTESPQGSVEGCSVVISSAGVRPLVVEGFKLHRVYSSCGLCRPGTWSLGGDGVLPATHGQYLFHLGGCVVCPVGTFSADSGAGTEETCQVCPKNYGYWGGSWRNWVHEGVTSCTYRCSTSSAGKPGGGSCTGSYSQRSWWQQLAQGQAGTLGRQCPFAACISITSCPAGQFRLACHEMGSEANCHNVAYDGLCTWNGATCDGPEQCHPCPAGRVKDGSGNGALGSCAQCPPGGWSESKGHTTRKIPSNYYGSAQGRFQRQRYRCKSQGYTRFNFMCTGIGVGICPNGTYSGTWGAASSDTCLTCPKGHYCHQWKLYNDGVCDSTQWTDPPCRGHMLNPTPCRPSSGWHENECFACPVAVGHMSGAMEPTPCPEGTYGNTTGLNDPSQCLTCPAGTYCPEGTIEPILTDTFDSRSDLLGITTPEAVSYYGSGDRLICSNKMNDNSQGYLRDGHFTWYRRQWHYNEEMYGSYHQFWQGSNYMISNTDHSGITGSGSVYMNATGNRVVWQQVELFHETPIEMVARVWVYNRLEYRNISKVYKYDLSRWEPFAGISVRVHRFDNFSGEADDERVYHRSLTTTATFGAWHMVEVTFLAPWPVRWATVNLTTRGWYQGYALFDDASLRPSARRICNCSTGYYFNDSEPLALRKCRRCPPGFACSGGTMIRCVNSWSTVAYAGCQHCRDGWLCDSDGRGRHIACEPLSIRDPDQTCSPCPLGYACRDGLKRMCNSGKYGDGGYDCIVCHPGYYSPSSGVPEIECKRCPAGWFSVAGRDHCTKCPPNHYSPNGTACYECPAHHFAPNIEATACRSCVNPFLDDYNITIERNSAGQAIRVVPAVCEEDNDFRVERIQHLEGESLGEVEMSRTSPSVLYRAGPILGIQRFRVYVTAGYQRQEQYATVEILITNRAPVAQDDVMSLAHPTTAVTFDLSSLLFNDYDLDKDDIFFATATFTGAAYDATNLVISANRKTLTVDLPAGFLGPAQIGYTIMDKPAATVDACVAPVCRLSATTATLTLTALQGPPQAVDDVFSVLNGGVTSLDVLENDIDPEGDEIVITATSTATFGTVPAIRQSCTSCSGNCIGVNSPCTCSYDTQRAKCYPSNGREYFIDYNALTTACGTDTFTYTVKTHDGSSTATVKVTSTRCFCDSHPGLDIIFVLDGTASESEYAFQLSFIDGVQRRTTPGGNIYYGAIEVGPNTEMRDIQNVFIDPSAYGRNEDGDSFVYNLGEGLDAARTMKQTSGDAGRATNIVVLSSHDSNDEIGNALGAWNALSNIHFTTISISAVNTPYAHMSELSAPLDMTLVSYPALIGENGKIVEDVTDRACSIR